MPTKFDITTKPLHKAKPCIAQLIRDDGSVDWYENCKAGQLLEIKSGNQKSYINLDYNKLLNFNIVTDDKIYDDATETYNKLKESREKFTKDREKIELQLEKELETLKNILERPTNTDKTIKKAIDDKQKAMSTYEKRIEQLKNKYVSLSKNKIKNIGSPSKPVLGFVCYEKEFNALPFKAEHDSKAITQWMDDILKNKKDFLAQRAEGFGRMALYILIGIAVLAFIYFRWGAPLLQKAPTETAKETIAVISYIIPLMIGGSKKWLKKSKERNLQQK